MSLVSLAGIDSRSLYEASTIDRVFISNLLDESFEVEGLRKTVAAWAAAGNLNRIAIFAGDAVRLMNSLGVSTSRMKEFIILCMEVANEVE